MATKNEYDERADAVRKTVEGKFSSDPEATKRGYGMIADAAGDVVAGVGKIPVVRDIGRAISPVADVVGMAGAGLLGGANVGMEYLTGVKSPVAAKITDDYFNYLENKYIGKPAVKAVQKKEGVGPVGAPAVPAPETKVVTPVGAPEVTVAKEVPGTVPTTSGKEPWSRERRMKELGLNEGQIIRDFKDPKTGVVTDLLTNRKTPMENYKELPSEAYGIGGSKEKEAYLNALDREMGRQFPSAVAMGQQKDRFGLDTAITPAQREALDLKRAELGRSIFEFTQKHDLNKQENITKLAEFLSPTSKMDEAGDITTITKDPTFLRNIAQSGMYDEKTSRAILQAIELSAKRPMPKVGDVVGNKKYKGGDITNPNNWEKI